MNIAISFNDNYIVPARILIDSIAVHNKDVSLWVIYSNLSQLNIEILRNQTNEYGWKFFPIRLQERFKTITATLPCPMHFSEEMYFRLLLPWILSGCEKVLYMDCDILVRDELSELYNTDLGEKLVGAVYDFSIETREDGKHRLGLEGDYYNSGVQLLNLVGIRNEITEEEMINQIVDIYSKYQLVYPDQDILNKIYDKKIQVIDSRYNCSPRPYLIRKLKRPNEVKKSVIVHFITADKPWKKEYCMFYLLEYWRYLKKYMHTKEKINYWKHKPFIATYFLLVKNKFMQRTAQKGE